MIRFLFFFYHYHHTARAHQNFLYKAPYNTSFSIDHSLFLKRILGCWLLIPAHLSWIVHVMIISPHLHERQCKIGRGVVRGRGNFALFPFFSGFLQKVSVVFPFSPPAVPLTTAWQRLDFLNIQLEKRLLERFENSFLTDLPLVLKIRENTGHDLVYLVFLYYLVVFLLERLEWQTEFILLKYNIFQLFLCSLQKHNRIVRKIQNQMTIAYNKNTEDWDSFPLHLSHKLFRGTKIREENANSMRVEREERVTLFAFASRVLTTAWNRNKMTPVLKVTLTLTP